MVPPGQPRARDAHGRFEGRVPEGPGAGRPRGGRREIVGWIREYKSLGVPDTPDSTRAQTTALCSSLASEFGDELDKLVETTGSKLHPVVLGVAADLADLPFLKALVKERRGGARPWIPSTSYPVIDCLRFGGEWSDRFIVDSTARTIQADRRDAVGQFKDLTEAIEKLVNVKKSVSHTAKAALQRDTVEKLVTGRRSVAGAGSRWFSEGLRALLQTDILAEFRPDPVHNGQLRKTINAFWYALAAEWIAAFTLKGPCVEPDPLDASIEIFELAPDVLVASDGTEKLRKKVLGVRVTGEAVGDRARACVSTIMGVVGRPLDEALDAFACENNLGWSDADSTAEVSPATHTHSIMYGPIARINSSAHGNVARPGGPNAQLALDDRATFLKPVTDRFEAQEQLLIWYGWDPSAAPRS
ncbi:hypothetical protein JCM10212_006752 [Sporobolomyces blumeae]